MEPDPVDVVLATRYQDASMSALLPRELVLEVHLLARTQTRISPCPAESLAAWSRLLSFAVNALVSPRSRTWPTRAARGLTRRRFWQREVELQRGLPRPGVRSTRRCCSPLLEVLLPPCRGAPSPTAVPESSTG